MEDKRRAGCGKVKRFKLDSFSFHEGSRLGFSMGFATGILFCILISLLAVLVHKLA